MPNHDDKQAKNALMQLMDCGENAVLEKYFENIAHMNDKVQQQLVIQEKAYKDLEKKLQEMHQSSEERNASLKEDDETKSRQFEYGARTFYEFFLKIYDGDPEKEDNCMLKLFNVALKEKDENMVKTLMNLNMPLHIYKRVFEYSLENHFYESIVVLIRSGMPKVIYKDIECIRIAETSSVDAYEKVRILKSGTELAEPINYLDKMAFEIYSKAKKILKNKETWDKDLSNKKEYKTLSSETSQKGIVYPENTKHNKSILNVFNDVLKKSENLQKDNDVYRAREIFNDFLKESHILEKKQEFEERIESFRKSFFK